MSSARMNGANANAKGTATLKWWDGWIAVRESGEKDSNIDADS
jgi:hypothetical protein